MNRDVDRQSSGNPIQLHLTYVSLATCVLPAVLAGDDAEGLTRRPWVRGVSAYPMSRGYGYVVLYNIQLYNYNLVV